MSRGAGRWMRAVLRELEKSPERKRNRLELESALVEKPHDASNLLRGIRALQRHRLVAFSDERHKRESVVSLPPKLPPVSEDEVSRLLEEINEKERAWPED